MIDDIENTTYAGLAELKIKAIAASDKYEGHYALYAGKWLFVVDIAKKTITKRVNLPNIREKDSELGEGRVEGKELEIAIVFRHPYICITERYGLHAALINLDSGTVRELEREDYHCDVSSYSADFLEREGRVLLICQSQWNRLDIYDAESGENLSEREVYWRKSSEKKEDGSTLYEYKNYLNFFHSRLHISPDGKHFLSNGWVWHPQDSICLFETETFLSDFEPSAVWLEGYRSSGYNWDRPCTFIDNNLFVVALDDERSAGELDQEELEGYEYRQLAFYRVDGDRIETRYGSTLMNPCEAVTCSAFTPQEYGEVKGRLYYHSAKARLVAITANGAFAIRLTGEITACIPDVFTGPKRLGWGYSPEHDVFYTWQEGAGIVEKRFE
ncbi:MAG: hypothetical protein FWG66_07720 [Spirochaetes bacterium]|nr:hypothetical protein [Spirochaetota bacterium]